MKNSRTTLLLALSLLAPSVLSLTGCGQDRDRGSGQRDAAPAASPAEARSTEDAEPAKGGGVPVQAEAGPAKVADAGSPTADAGAAVAADGGAKTAPSKLPAEQPSSTPDAGSPVKVKQDVDAGPPASDGGGAVGAETDQLTALLQKVYRDVKTFEADFEQTYRNILLDKTRESSGHVWLQPPSKMRWEYDPPSKNLIVADGQKLYVYEPEANQVVQLPVAGSELPSVMAFLTGGHNLSEDYEVREVHRDKLAPQGQAGLELRPRTPSTVISRVVLVIDRQTGQVQRTILVEPEGNTNTFVWSKVKTGVEIPAKQFIFTPPAGARIVER